MKRPRIILEPAVLSSGQIVPPPPPPHTQSYLSPPTLLWSVYSSLYRGNLGLNLHCQFHQPWGGGGEWETQGHTNVSGQATWQRSC